MNHSDLKESLRQNQCRLTKARMEIFDLLKKSQSSLSVKEVFDQLSPKSSTDLVSVYRNLSLFNELGLAHKFQDGSFALCRHDHDHHHHVHFITHCIQCGKKSEIPNHSSDICKIATQIKKVSKPLKTFHEIIIQGHCPKCC